MTQAWRHGKQTTAERGYGSMWQKARLRHLQDNPLCVFCFAEKRITLATVVDHIIPLAKGGSHTAQNLQCLCRACNISKSDRYIKVCIKTKTFVVV